MPHKITSQTVNRPPNQVHARLKLQHLATLVSIGHHRNAHRTAQEMALSQPAISKIIREVEQLFGTVLFERGRAGMIPNRVGEALISRANTLLNDIDRTGDEIEAIAAGHIGSLRLGVIAFIAPDLITRVLNRLSAENVTLATEIHEGVTQSLVTQLMAKELDCVIGRYSFEHEADLDQQLLSQQRFAVVISRSHPALKRGPITLGDTTSFPWVVTPPRTSARQALTDMFMRAGLRAPDVRVETASMEIMKAVLADCGMIGLLPLSIATQYEAAGQVEILDFPIDFPPAPLMLIRRRDEPPLPSVVRFCEALFEIAPQVEAPARNSNVPVNRGISD